MDEKVNPTHYNKHTIQPVDVVDDWGLDYYLGSAVKYICRAGKKESESNHDDIRKAQKFLSLYIERVEEQYKGTIVITTMGTQS